MTRYARTAEERKVLDDLVLEVIKGGTITTPELREAVQARLVATGQPWAKALARAATFHTTLRSSVARLRDTHRVRCSRHGGESTWSALT